MIEKNSKGNITTFEYGARNQVIRRMDHGGRTEADGVFTYADDKVESYTYFEDGRVKTIKDRNGVTTANTYDIHGRIRTKAAGQTFIAYTYDSNGNMLTITDSTGVTIRKYDALNRVVEKTSPDIGKSVYVYDIITGVDAGETGERATDPKGNITLKIYDRLGRIGKVTAEGNTTTYGYDDNGNKKSVQYQDGSMEEFTYYKDNLLKAMVNKKSDGTVLESYSYTYDGAHNQTSKVDKKGTTTYTYDVLNRLETVTEPSGKTTAYEFDGAGNRTKETITENGVQITTSYNYNGQNRLMSTVIIGGAKGLVTYGYDNNGNLISEDKGTITTHTYDEFNQLNLTVSGTNIIKARYNGEGKRVEREVNGDVTKFLYEGDNVVLEVDAAGAELARNIYGNNLIQRKAQGQLLKYFYNGHGDVTALVDDTGIIAATYYYDSFGNMLEETGTAKNPYRYRGYEYDKEIGQYYLKSRYYNPEIGRFMSEDSYRGDRMDPLSLNLYTYCYNEPIMHFDSTGHYVENDDGAATSGGVSLGNDGSTQVPAQKKSTADVGKLSEGTPQKNNNSGTNYKKGDTIQEGEYKGWKVSQGFNDTKTNRKGHLGMDLLNGSNSTTITPIMSGTIAHIDRTNSTRNGNIVVIQSEINGVKFYSSYSHLANGSIPKELNVGDEIKIDDKIGTMGGTGGGGINAKNKFDPHLHLAVYTGPLSKKPLGYGEGTQTVTFGHHSII